MYKIARFCEKLYFKKRIVLMNEKEIMTVKQVAEYLQMDEHTVYKLARSGQIPSPKIAGQWGFKKEILDNLGIYGTGNQGYKVFLKEKI